MTGRFQLAILLASGLSFSPYSESLAVDRAITGCNQDVRPRNVLVLDVEPLRGNTEAAQQFVDERAGEFRLLNSGIEEIRTRTPPSRDPDGLVRSARRLGAQRGCDLVLVLKTGPYFGRQRSPNARMKDRGYAFVVLGQRTTGHH